MLTLLFTNNPIPNSIYDVALKMNAPLRYQTNTLREVYGMLDDMIVQDAMLDIDLNRSTNTGLGEAISLIKEHQKTHTDTLAYLGNIYALVDAFPNANIVLAEYSPSLVFASHKNFVHTHTYESAPDDETMIMALTNYCVMKRWLNINNIKYSLLKMNVDTSEFTPDSIAGTNKLNILANAEDDSAWDTYPHNITKIIGDKFKFLGYNVMTEKEICASNT